MRNLVLILFLFAPLTILYANEEPKDYFSVKENIKNFTFERFVGLKTHKSTDNHILFQTEDNRFGLSIDIGKIPEHYNGTVNIKELIKSPYEFALEANKEDKRNFSDIKLLDYRFSPLGNIDALLVKQISTLISGQKIEMYIDKYSVVSEGYYMSFSFVYSPKYADEVKRTVKSFNFTSTIKKTEPTKINSPSIKETEEWILSKLRKYTIAKKNFQPSSLSNPKKEYIYSNYNFNIINYNLVISYKCEFYKGYIKNPNNVVPIEHQLRFSNDYNLEETKYFKYIIPIKDIESVNYSNNNVFAILTKRNKITIIESGNTTYDNYFSCNFSNNQEDNFGDRIYKAIIHLKALYPNKNANSEAF